MTTLLQINASLFANEGQSSQLANRFVAAWQSRNPEGQVLVRDLAADPVPHLDGERFSAFLSKPGERSVAQQAVVDYSDALIEELKAADVVVLGLPLYNFGVPSTLKAYFDHIARAGVTFRYAAQGPEGLLRGKKAYVMATRGGHYAGTPLDTQTAFIRNFLAFIGIADVEFVYAEGLALGDEPRSTALAKAREQVERLAA
ncbi:MAG TPA: NAD(P)H-dependent oxidoreductase [Rhodocyclaceae bacterium]|jgi:FMN-dependent NADH-azoreductase|nr:NAD(P)H-dependent oxidoreductase [Rhodocyclaceae bacterium]HMV21998.1 NAD(P)H-dependent oxidoreductase [Rhodocyclaceae bacterium]HMW78183.1 NAD(P)H-dependent oxidoreductase [Rhodocyclaceae bacterium]HNE43862.1 NAD(P)H-dependent oxidoreductase [Rhodocyclaceae bacterium]HNM22794.1 NAD(P)H-dependent oxidoreductase [Rhodocyclaceae bacterium]